MGRGGLVIVPFLIALLAAPFICPDSYGAEKKAKKQATVAKNDGVKVPEPGGFSIFAYYKEAEDRAKKGKIDPALRMFLYVHDYTVDLLAALQTVQARYEKASSDSALSQSQREDFYIKLQRIKSLTSQYHLLQGESAYNIGLLYAKRGDPETARKYLTEACDKLPFSLEANSLWMKSKNQLLSLFHLEGEF